MVKDFFKSIRIKILTVTMSFTLITTVSVSIISFYIYGIFLQNSLIQSAEFNLQLVSGSLTQNLNNINTLVNWCCSDDDMVSYLSNRNSSPSDAIAEYKSLLAEYQNNRTGDYIERLIITDVDFSKLLQVGKAAGDYCPVTIYNVGNLFSKNGDTIHAWQDIEQDSFRTQNSTDSSIISISRPIYYSSKNEIIGYLYLSVSTAMITDRLKDYSLDAGSNLYLTLGSNHYRIKNASFIKDSFHDIHSISSNSQKMLSSNIKLYSFKDADGMAKKLVQSKIGSTGMILSNSIPNRYLDQQREFFSGIVILICLCIIVLGALITVFLNRTITVPVSIIQKRLNVIAKGDFSQDTDIEWNNELGDIGRGINYLSKNVISLMDKRIADEKNKQDLEYQLLQSQISPHFLYNTLNSIKWMATIQNATGIAEMTTALSRLLKSIAKGTKKIIPLRSEIELMDNYFLIQKYRFGGSITLVKEIAADVMDNAILKFTLQPLVENAIIHGIVPNGGIGTIQIKACHTENQNVKISVIDNGVGMKQDDIDQTFQEKENSQSDFFKNVGLTNINKRIQYEFGKNYGLSITSELGVYTEITILLPDQQCEI